jgi:glycerophosphoryl diester phosphodiesterase
MMSRPRVSGHEHAPRFGFPPIAMAHRGGAAEGAENSPVTFQRAIDLGFRHIETDVQATGDGHALIFHDADLARTTNESGPVAGLCLADASSIRLADGASPITLTEALRRWPDTFFNVDVKSDAAIGPFLRAVAGQDAWSRVCAASFSSRRLGRLRSLAGSRLMTSMGPVEVATLVLGLPVRLTPLVAQVPERQGSVPVVTQALVTRAHRRGIQVHVWTVDEEAQMHRLLDLGVDGLITDRPTVLRRVLEQRGSWH